MKSLGTVLEDKPANYKIIFALFLLHFSGDLFSSFLTPLFPVFAEKFSLSLAQIGMISGLSAVLAFVVQPTVGYLADRYQSRIFLLGGPALIFICIPLTGIAPSYGALLFLAMLGSAGSSMFHPTAAGMVANYSGRNAAFCMACFGVGGTLAFGVGPLVATSLVGSFGLESLPYTMIYAAATWVLLFFVLPTPESEGLKDFGFIGAIKEIFGDVWKAIFIIWLLIVLRSFVTQCYKVYIPIFFADQGYPLESLGLMISLFIVSGAISGLLAGHLSDRFGPKPIFIIFHLISTPFLLYFLNAGSELAMYIGAASAGFWLLATMSMAISVAQRLAPKGKSMVSSLTMGLAFGMGGLVTPIAGKLADIYGIHAVLTVVAFIPTLTLILVFLLPKEALQRP